MAEKILHTRIVNKHDTLENWISSDLILKEGEIALAKVETATQDAKGNIIYVPTFLMKVGDGTSTFAALNWLSAPASDVYSWAKAATKPTYSASEITGLSDYISGEIQDTDTQYKLVKVSDYNYKLQSKTLNGSWTDVDGSSIVIPDDTASITALQNLVGDTKVSTQIDNAIAALKLADNYDSKGSAAQALTDAKAYTDALANGAVKTNTDAIAAIKDGSTIDSFADVETALAGKQAAGDYATRTEAQGYATSAKNAVIGNDSDNADSNTVKGAKKYADSLNTAMDTRMDAAEASITTLTGADTVDGSVAKALKDAKAYADGKDTAIAAAKSAADAAQADVDALEAKVGTVPESKTVVQMIEEAQQAATYDDTALAGRVTTVEGKVTTLIGEDASKSARTIASEEVAKIVAGADTAYDTLKEIADWISSHKSDATAMNSAIVALEGIVDGIGGEGEKATVVEYVTDAIAALQIGDYAKAADLTALAGRVATLEGQAHTHSNKALLDTYTQTEANLADAVAKKHEHSNKEELDKIASGDKAKWDAAVQTVTAGTGLTATKTGTDVAVGIDDNVVFVLDCGTSTVNI